MKKESSNHNPLEITSINELNQNGFVPISRESNLGRLLRLRRFTVLPTVAVLVLLASACGGRGGNDNSLPPESRPSQPPVASDVSNRVLPLSGDVFLTQGPHAWDDGNGIKSSLDFAPRRIVDCPAGARITVDEQDAVASVSGTIVVVGDQENRNDQKHSIIEIQEDGTGLRFEHMHLDKFLPNVRIGNKVRARDPIAKPSCEVPKGGRTTGIHEHIDIKDPNGNYIPINGLTFSGWTISGNTMTKPGEETRTADGRRCGPDKASINNCGGIRNDLINVNVKGTVAGPKPPIPPLSTPKIGETKSPEKLETKFYTDMGNPSSESKFSLTGWGAAQVPPDQKLISPSGDKTKRYQLLRRDNLIAYPVEPNHNYRLTAEVEDGSCTDNFQILANGVTLYSFFAQLGDDVVRTHTVDIPQQIIKSNGVIIDFRNTSSDNCGLAAVFNVKLESK